MHVDILPKVQYSTVFKWLPTGQLRRTASIHDIWEPGLVEKLETFQDASSLDKHCGENDSSGAPGCNSRGNRGTFRYPVPSERVPI